MAIAARFDLELIQALKKIGYKQIPHELCAYTKDGVIILFYVDDIVVTFRNQMREQAPRTVIQL